MLRSPWWKRLGWLIVIWSASVAALALAAWLMRLLMRGAGLSN
jgi:hypothetical protein